MFQSLSDDPIILEVMGKQEKEGSFIVSFDVFYFNIKIGEQAVKASLKDPEIVWVDVVKARKRRNRG